MWAQKARQKHNYLNKMLPEINPITLHGKMCQGIFQHYMLKLTDSHIYFLIYKPLKYLKITVV